MVNIISSHIKEILDSKGLSLSELADMSYVDEAELLAVVEKGKLPSLDVVISVSDAVGLPLYWFFMPLPNFFSSWHVTLEELTEMVACNPSLRGFMVGYMAESKLRSLFSKYKNISGLYKPDDHDRRHKGDLVLTYRGCEFTFEIKSLQTNTIRQTTEGGFYGTFQCDASDRREILLPNGHVVNTTCLKFGDFDIVAINLFAFTQKWEYAFALNTDLPHASQGRGKNIIPVEDLEHLIKSSIKITYPLQAPFVSDPFMLMDRMVEFQYKD